MGADALLLIKVLAIVGAFGVLTVVLLALLDAAAERMRRGLLLRRRFGKGLRSRPDVEEDTQELTLEDTQELIPLQRSRQRFSGDSSTRAPYSIDTAGRRNRKRVGPPLDHRQQASPRLTGYSKGHLPPGSGGAGPSHPEREAAGEHEDDYEHP